MHLLDSQLYQEDLQKGINIVVCFQRLKNCSILVTGATGLVCSALIDILINSKLGITVYAATRNESKVKDRFNGQVEFLKYDATKPIEFDVDVDYIIHGASNSSPNLYISEPVETMKANINGMENLLDYSREKGVKKIVYISSSEVYGEKDTGKPFTEDQYGFIDLLSPRSSYSISKRATETLLASYKSEYGIDFNIVRLGHIYGPTASKNDKRISSDFAYKAAMNENLTLKSLGDQVRSYCYCIDCASAILTVLNLGKGGEAYNVSNRYSIITIRHMAQILAAAAGEDLHFEIPKESEVKAFNPMNNSSLDSSKLEKLGWNGQFSPEEGLSHTVSILKELLGDDR